MGGLMKQRKYIVCPICKSKRHIVRSYIAGKRVCYGCNVRFDMGTRLVDCKVKPLKTKG